MKKLKLSRRTSHRIALLKSLSISLVKHDGIKTTLSKAKALRPFVEKLVTIAKRNSLHAMRLLISKIGNEEACKKMINVVGPQFKERNGGYTRIVKLGERKGDCAPMSYIKFVNSSKS